MALTSFRRGGTGQIILGAVVFAIIVVFVMEFRPGRQGAGGVSRECAVKVLDGCVDRKEYFAALGLTVPRGLPPKKVKELGLRKAVMEGLVERELLLREAERLGVSVSEKEVDDELAEGRARISIPMQQLGPLSYTLGVSEEMVRPLPVKSSQTGAFDYKIYERIVRNTTNRSPREFKEMQRREIIASRMRDLVKSRVRVAETEAFTQWERERSKAVARVVALKRDWFGKWVVDASDAAVDAWAAKNDKQVEEGWKQAQPSWKAQCPLVSEILVKVEEEAGDATKTEARQKADGAAARVKKGEAFDQVARTTSDGMTAHLGGELGCMNEGYGPGAKEVLEQLAKMKPGEVSPVIESARGLHVIKLHGLLAEKDVEKIGKRTIARRLGVAQMAAEQAKEFADALLEKVKAGAKLEDATQQLAAAYAARRDKPKKAPVLLPGATPPPAAKKEGEPPALADSLRPSVEITAPFAVIGSPVEDADPKEAAASKVFALEKADQVVDKAIATKSGYAVIQLKEKTPAKKEDFAKDRLTILRGMRLAKEADAVTRYVAALRAKAKEKITIDARLLEESTQDDGSGDG